MKIEQANNPQITLCISNGSEPTPLILVKENVGITRFDRVGPAYGEAYRFIEDNGRRILNETVSGKLQILSIVEYPLLTYFLSRKEA